MRGGVRKGSGRKNLSNADRKKAKNIYLSDKQIENIEKMSLVGCSSFSQKCSELISLGIATINKNEEKNTQKVKFIDLFAGIGGIRQGFEDENTQCVFSSEWDKYAAKTYEANFGEIPYGDITQISENDIPDHDVLLAGFPCQPFSNIGKREGFAHETQGTLFFDVLRILNKKQPKMFLLENVKGLLTNDGGNTFKVIISELEALGYSVFYEVLDAQNFGLPQRRERIIIVGFHPLLEVETFEFPKGDIYKKVPINSILEKDAKGYSISKHLQESYLFKKDDGKPQLVDMSSTIQVNTLVASYHKIQRLTGTFVKDGETGIRMFSEQELKKLMGFPDDFIVPVSRTQMYRQFGNSVAVPMIAAVATVMKEKLKYKRESREISAQVV